MKKFLFIMPLLAGILTVSCGSEKKADKYTDIEYEKALNLTKYATENLQASIIEDKDLITNYGIDFECELIQTSNDKTETVDDKFNAGTVTILGSTKAKGRLDLKDKEMSVITNYDVIEQENGILKGTKIEYTEKGCGTIDEEFYILENKESLGRYLANTTNIKVISITNGKEEEIAKSTIPSAMAYRGTSTNGVKSVTTSLESLSYENINILPTALETTHSDPNTKDKLIMQSIKTVDGYDGFLMKLELGEKTKDGITGEMYSYNEVKAIWDEDYNLIEMSKVLENITETESLNYSLHFKVDKEVNDIKFQASKFASGAPGLEEFTNPTTVEPVIANMLII